MTCSLQPHCQTSALPDSIEGVPYDSGRPRTLGFLSSSSFQLFGDSGVGDAANSLGVFSDPLSFQDGEQTQANGGSWETLLDNTITPFSPGRRSFMPTPYGRDIQDTGMENISPFAQQVTGIAAYVSNPQSPHHDDFPLFDLNQDIDFSMYLNSPYRLSTASGSSRMESNPRRSVESRSISPFQLTDYDDTYRGNRESDLVSRSTAAADQALDLVTEEDLEAESIISLLGLLKSLAFSRFDTASQNYEYDESMLSDLLCSDWCKWMCHEVEGLLDLYPEMFSRSIRKHRTATFQNSLPSGCNLNLNERRQGFVCTDGPQRLSNPIEATVTTEMRITFFRYCSTLMGQIVFEVNKGPSNPIGEEEVDSNHLITMSFMPRAKERTPGICVRLSRTIGGPAISPQINTFNVVPDDSAIIQCVRKNDLRGIQTLFDLGAASARDVDSRGISLLHVGTAQKCEQFMSLLTELQYAMFTGCTDVLRLLIQGGASINECYVWTTFVKLYSGLAWIDMASSVEKLKNFEECVAITQVVLDNDCTMDSADDRRLHAGPLSALVGTDRADIDASTLVDAVDYLLSICWDLEDRNAYGQTPFLYAAATCGPQVARCLRTLIEKGARLDARDEMGRGPLLSALTSPLGTSNWIDLTYIWGIEDGHTMVTFGFLVIHSEQKIAETYEITTIQKVSWIRSPSHVLKDRVRVKLKILLEAGCDPNEVDKRGQSKNDYARGGVWSQWLWALDKTGYVFDEEHDRWIKRTDSA